MPIEYRPSGEPAAIAQAGLTIGQAEREKEERARAERATEQASQDRTRQMAMDWEAQKMLLNSQQDFAHEQRIHQADLDSEARAKEWEVQKMGLRSQMDFQQEEQKRQKEIGEFFTTDKYIRDKVASGELSKEKEEDLLFMNAYRHPDLNIPEVVARLGKSSEYVQRARTGKSGEESAVETALRNLGGTTDDGTPPPTKVWVYTNKGKLASIPANELEEAVAEGAKLAPGQKLPKSPAFQEAQTQWMIEQQLLKGTKGYILDELASAYKTARNPEIDPKNPFASLIAESKIADIRKKYPAYFEEYARPFGGRP